ncbi:MAG TPA: phosphoglycerate dehydrogenase [Candidatus Limnocylindria bacterium]|nr:phosphoglycerate dehydrogenase [Candidatus Limnocylindria bacterium]
MPDLRVMVTCPPMQLTADEWLTSLTDLGIEVEIPPVTQHVSRADLERLLPTCDGIIAGDEPLDRALLEMAVPRLRMISRWGVGIDNVDLEAARDLGIEVRNTPAVFADEVADVAIGYLIMLARHLHRIDAGVRAGGWPKPQGTSLAGRTLGVVGLGAIGRAVARRGFALGMDVVGFDPMPQAGAAAAELGVRVVAMDALFEQASVVSLNCPLTPETRGLVNAERLARMAPGSFVVNTARGPVVDEAALIESLRSGHIAGAALDVFEVEPLPSDSPLRDFENVILGSHNASNTAEAVSRVNRLAIDNLLAILQVPRA